MRILMMVSSIAMGGSERNIVSVLPYLKMGGCDVHLCTLNRRRDSPLADILFQYGISRYDLGAVRMLDIKAVLKFFTYTREMKIDIIHAEDQDAIIYAGMAHILLGIPTLMTRHVMEEPVTSWKTAQRARLVFLSARHGMNHVVAVSNIVRKNFVLQAKIPMSKVTTIYNGIEVEKFRTQERRNDIRSGLGWNLKRPIGIFISVLRPGKGFEVLLEAIPLILAVLPDFQLKVVGGGELESDLRKQAAPFGDVIEFMGQRMDVPKLLACSDVLIQTSWSEALPTVLIEAGAACVPVVATDVGGTKEIVKDGESGFVIPPGDVQSLAKHVTEILKSPNLAQKMGSSAYAFVSKTFSLEKQAMETIALYEKILEKRL